MTATSRRRCERIATGLLLVLASPLFGQTGTFNYGEALQKAIFFYDVQRSGPLPAGNRVGWRGDSTLQDGADNGVDLTGGWFDAGDHVKFGLPMASSTTLLAWGVLEYESAFLDTKQMAPMLANLRWATDYFLKASSTPNQLWGQVGEGGADHAFWGSAEVLPMARPSYKITADCPGSDLAGETAAALAAASLVFQREGDPDYAGKLLSRAKSLYQFAETYQGKYSDCITVANGFYTSSGYADELAWGAAWLYKATGVADYLTKAQTWYAKFPLQPGTPFRSFGWTHNWDDKTYGTYVLLSKITGQAQYRADAERWLDFWTIGFQGQRVRYTPGGLAWLDQWGSLRYAANTAFLAMIYSDWLTSNQLSPDKSARYVSFAERQLNYMLGDNPLQSSYEIGFGVNPPHNPHHRTAHGSWANNINLPANSVHTLYGALVGGPDASDQYADSRSDYVKNEVATDYNAAFTGALARMFVKYGGSILNNFPIPETPSRDEIFSEGLINAQGQDFIEIAAFANSQTAWPARVTHNTTLRYFFTVPSDDPSGVTLSHSYNECADPVGPLRWAATVYYVDINCGDVSPAGQSASRKQTQFRITAPSRNASNDWSISGLNSSGATKTRRINVYVDGVLAWGDPPPGGVPLPLTIATASLPDATAGAPYQAAIQAAGGTLPYVKWDVAAGALPSGFTLDAAAGSIAGQSSSTGTATFSIRVTDAAGGVAVKPFTLTVDTAPPLAITSRTLGTPFAGTNYQATLTATGGVPPYQWSIIQGNLPIGLTLSNNLIAGVPQTVGDSNFTIQVTDQAGTVSQHAFGLSVAAPPHDATLKLLYRSNFPTPASNQIGPQFKIVNAGAGAIPISELTVRYYFTIENPQPLNWWCDYAAVDCANVSARFVDMGAGGMYLEASFAGKASLAPGADSGDVDLRFAKADWTDFDQSNDYSFDASKTSYAVWDHITVYRNGALVWGVEPRASNRTTTPAMRRRP
ncbi:MAG: glycoside hydrolase family 9 protein [Acidobacteriia bacterium]|nr:glycoside hydrolase family 9 protein [Terriglobia bacterium]